MADTRYIESQLSDQSTAPLDEKLRRFLADLAMRNRRPCAHLHDDGYPRPSLQRDADMLLALIEVGAITLGVPVQPADAVDIDYYRACERQNVALLDAIGYPHEKDSLTSPEEYAADLKCKADAYDAAGVQVAPATEEKSHG